MTDASEDGAPASSDVDVTQAASATARPSISIGPYRLLERIGEGGMGEVWLAEQARPVQRQVALKVIKAGMDTAQVIARFDAERQALALMDHPSIARVFDGGVTPQGRPYFVMEFVRGESITAYASRHKLPLRQRIELFMQVCEGVQHAHQKGIIHRDLKPSNILITVRDDHPSPKIIDFGLAKAMTQSLTERTLHTEFGALVGTPEYMSPEQAEMSALDIDTRTDVYALGVVLYELLTGMMPFEAKTLREKGLDEIRRTIREVDPPKPSTRVTTSATSVEQRPASGEPARLASQLRGDLDWITMKALEKDRTRRYGSVSDLTADLRRHLDDVPVLASPPSARYRVGKFVRRHRSGVAAAGALVVLLVAFAVAMAVQARRIAQARDRASEEAAAATQVSDFLVGLFKVSDPSEARGTMLTAREILAKGARQLDSLGNQPSVQARLQATIGSVDVGLGLYKDAQPLLESALQTRRRVSGEDSLDTVAAASALADVYWYQRKYQEAERLYRDVVERRTRLLGAEHRDTLRASFDLASAILVANRWDEYEGLAKATLAKQRRVLGVDHPDTLSSLNNLQAFLFMRKRFDEAEPIASEVLGSRRRVLGDSHPDTLNAMHNLAAVYGELGRYDEAEVLHRKAIESSRRVLGDNHPRVYRALYSLGSMYTKQHRYDEAESTLMDAYEGFIKVSGRDDLNTRLTVTQLAEMYLAAGKPAKAAEWRAKLSEPTANAGAVHGSEPRQKAKGVTP